MFLVNIMVVMIYGVFLKWIFLSIFIKICFMGNLFMKNNFENIGMLILVLILLFVDIDIVIEKFIFVVNF